MDFELNEEQQQINNVYTVDSSVDELKKRYPPAA